MKIESTLNKNDFHPIDHLFVDRVCPNAHPDVAYCLASLMKSAREGHLCLSLSENLQEEVIRGVSMLPTFLFEKILVKERDKLYLRRNWECENFFLKHLKRLKSQTPNITIPIDSLKVRLESEPLNDEQKKAILQAAISSLALISGGPGSGKTYTATKLIRLFFEQGIKKIVVSAPTGKATANMRANLGAFAEQCTFKTLHALTQKEKIHADLIVVDESSMIDAQRMALLFGAVEEGARLVLLGDKDQLPPIESGNFFADLSQDQSIISELVKCLRTDLKEIIELAANIKKGVPIPFNPLPDINSLLKIIIEKQIPVLTPMRKGLYGVDHLNQLLYKEFQKNDVKEIPIIITVNDPYLELSNGDSGILVKEEGTVYFSNGKKIPEYLLTNYEYAYVLSVHKSQGSEYDNAMILLPKGSEFFGRSMLYTAITRVKKQIMILAHEGVIENLVQVHYQRRSAVINALFNE